MELGLIEKPGRADVPPPNLQRYDEARKQFSWSPACAQLPEPKPDPAMPGGMEM